MNLRRYLCALIGFPLLLNPVAFGQTQVQTDCDPGLIEDLFSAELCDERKSPGACSAAGMAVAGSLSALKLVPKNKNDKGAISEDLPNVVETNRKVIAAVKKARHQAQRDVREFARAVLKVLDNPIDYVPPPRVGKITPSSSGAQVGAFTQTEGSSPERAIGFKDFNRLEPGGLVGDQSIKPLSELDFGEDDGFGSKKRKIKGFRKGVDNVPSWFQVYTTYRTEIDRLIPNNNFSKFLKTFHSPDTYIQHEINKASRTASGDLPSNLRASFQGLIKIEQQRFAEYWDRAQQRAGTLMKTKGIVPEINRSRTAREVLSSRKEPATFRYKILEQCNRPARGLRLVDLGAVAAVGASTSALASVKNCEEQYGTPLTETDKMFLIESSTMSKGVGQGFSCDNFSINSDAVNEYLNAKPGKYSKQLETYLCKYSERKLSEKVKELEKYKEINPDCNHLDFPSDTNPSKRVVASMNNGILQLKLGSGQTVTMPVDSNKEWVHARIKSSDPALQDYLVNKVRHPAISPSGRKQLLSPEFSCGTGSTSKEMCEIAKAIDAWNHFGEIGSLSCENR